MRLFSQILTSEIIQQQPTTDITRFRIPSEGSKGIESRAVNGAYGFGLGVHGTPPNRSHGGTRSPTENTRPAIILSKNDECWSRLHYNSSAGSIQLAVGAELGTGIFHLQNYKYLKHRETTGDRFILN